jgi:TolB protein
VRSGLIVVAALALAGCAGHAKPPLHGTIAFLRGGERFSGVPQVAALDADGTHLRVLARGSNVEAPIRWSPEGTKLVFSLSQGSRPSRLWVVNTDGSGLRRITRPKYEDDMNPAWSPDGRRIVFDAQGDGWTDLRVVNVDGTGERKLATGSYTTGNPATTGGGDVWSPDGREILFVDEHGRLGLMRPDGTHRHRLAHLRSAHGAGSWSQDGGAIVFSSARGGIAVAKVDGSGLRTIARSGLFPVWSPDGRKIVFVDNGGVFVVDKDGSGLRKIGRSGDHPSWSPDGRWVVYASSRSGSGDIYIVRPDGRGERQLTKTKIEEGDPVWAR